MVNCVDLFYGLSNVIHFQLVRITFNAFFEKYVTFQKTLLQFHFTSTKVEIIQKLHQHSIEIKAVKNAPTLAKDNWWCSEDVAQ